ncbi:MAG: mechanosensitive ion channel [Thermoanaerobaculia bacterium]|nr:mechanosensitive ion channel [Thermoanaerobaculia bacterium]
MIDTLHSVYTETLLPVIDQIRSVLNAPLVHLGETSLTLGTILYLALLVLVILWISGKFKKLFLRRILSRSQMDIGAQQAVATILHYLLVLIGLMIVLQTSGIDLTTLNVLAGAVGVGIGLGLQEIVNNFISGLVILFERPIKVNDRIQVGDVDGKVTDIKARSTTVLTNDNVSIIIPNSKFITENVINWTFNDPKMRFRVPVGVSYGSNPHRVKEALLAAAGSHEGVLEEPKPGVWFRAFGESSLNFELLVWTSSMVHNPGRFVSDLNYAIHDKLKEFEITVPFPQRDLYLKSGPIEVRMNDER